MVVVGAGVDAREEFVVELVVRPLTPLSEGNAAVLELMVVGVGGIGAVGTEGEVIGRFAPHDDEIGFDPEEEGMGGLVPLLREGKSPSDKRLGGVDCFLRCLEVVGEDGVGGLTDWESASNCLC